MGLAAFFIFLLFIAFFILLIIFINVTKSMKRRLKINEKEIKKLKEELFRVTEFLRKISGIELIQKKLKIDEEKIAAKEIKIEKEKKTDAEQLKQQEEEKKRQEAIKLEQEKAKKEQEIILKKQQEELNKKLEIEKAKQEELRKKALEERRKFEEKQKERQEELLKRKKEKRAKRNEFVKKAMELFVDHWIVIVASIIMVMGLSFLGWIAIIYMNAMARFFLIIGVSILFLALYFVLNRFELWKKLAVVLRSMSAAVFLFACVGSAGIPGLKWINSQLVGLIFIITGITYNIVLTFIGRKEYLAVIHVLLSLIAVSFVTFGPKTEITLILACLITISGIILTYWQKWEYHLLINITLFFAYIIFWNFIIGSLDLKYRIVGICCVAVVGILTLFVHYRKIYSTSGFAIRPFLTHILNWAYLGVGLVLFLPKENWVSILVCASAVVIFIISRIAKVLKIRWLYITDVLVSQVVAYTGIITLYSLEIKFFPIVSIMFFTALAFTYIMLLEKEKFFYRLGVILQNILGVILIIINFTTIEVSNIRTICWHSFILLLSTIALITFNIICIKKYNILFEKGDTESTLNKYIKFNFVYFGIISILTILNIILLVFQKSELIHNIRLEFVLVTSTLFFILTRRKIHNKVLNILDGIVVQILAYIAVLFLLRWKVDIFLITAIMFAETMVFTLIMLFRKEKILSKIGIVLQNLLSLILIISSFILMSIEGEILIFSHSVIFLVSTIVIICFNIIFIKKHNIHKKFIQNKMVLEFSHLIISVLFLIFNIILLIFKTKINWTFIEWNYSLHKGYLLLPSIFLFLLADRKVFNSSFKIIVMILLQLLSYFAALILFNWNVDGIIIFAIMFFETLIFNCIILLRREKILYKFGIVLQCLVSIIFVTASFFHIDVHNKLDVSKFSIIFIIASIGLIGFNLFFLKKYRNIFKNINIKKFHGIKSELIFLGSSVLLLIINILVLIFSNRVKWIGNIQIEFFLLASIFLFLMIERKIADEFMKNLTSILMQLLSYVATLTLFRWNIDAVVIIGILFFETLIFNSYFLIKKEKILYRISIVVQNILSVGFVILCFILTDISDNLVIYKNSILLISLTIGLILFNLLFIKKYKHIFKPFENKFLIKDYKLEIIFLISSIVLLASNIVLVSLMKFEWVKYIRAEFVLLVSTFLFILTDRKLVNKITKNIVSISLQGLSYAAALLLLRWHVDIFLIFSIMFVETLVFIMLNLVKKERMIYNLGTISINLIGIILLYINFVSRNNYTNTELIRNSIILGAVLLTGTLFHIFDHLRQHKLFETDKTSKQLQYFMLLNSNILGGLIALIPAVVYINLFFKLPWANFIGAEYIVLIPLIILLFLRNRFQINGMGIGLIITILVIHVFNIYAHYDNLFFEELSRVYISKFGVIKKILYSLPIFLISATSIKFSFIKKIKKYIKWFGIYLFFISFAFIMYFIFNPISNLIPGVLWLLSSVIILEVAMFLRNILGDKIVERGKSDFHLILVSYSYIIAFIIRHMVVHIQSETYIWIFKTRLLIEIFAIIIFIYLYFHKTPKGGKIYSIFKYAQRLLLELIMVSVFFTVLLEIEKSFVIPLIWSASSVVFFILGHFYKEKFERLKFYSLILFWISVIHIPIVSFKYFPVKINSLQVEWVFYVLAILCQFGFLTVFHLFKELKELEMPKQVGFFNPLIRLINKKVNIWVYYPLFISITLFFIWSFGIKYYAILFTAAAFIIFTISVILKESHFRYISLGYILASLVFLIIALVNYIRNESWLMAALIFIGMGLLLFAIYIINRIFRKRFIPEKTKDKNEKTK